MAGNFYYVSSVVDTDGLGNSYATDQVGNSFATLSDTNVYGTIEQAITAGAGADDDIICDDSHSYVKTTANLVYAGGASSALRISCATSADCGIRSSGALESTDGSSYDITGSGLIVSNGVDFTTGDLMNFTTVGLIFIFNNCTNKVNGFNNYINAYADGVYLEFNNVAIDFDDQTNYLYIRGGASIIINGGSVKSTTEGSVNTLTSGGFVDGGGVLHCTEVDLSEISNYLIDSVGASITNDDMIDVHIDKCPLNASLIGFHNETLTSRNQKILVTQSSSSSAAAEYQYYFTTRGGYVEDSTAFYRDNSTAFEDSGQKVSLKCVTDSNAELAMPFEFEFPTTFAALATATTDKLRIYILAADTLTDANVWAELTYPDGTTKNVFNSVNSLGTPSDIPIDIFRTPATLTTNTEAWKDRTTENRYQIDLDTSTDVGANCVPKIRLFVTNTANPVYFCTTVDVVA